MKQLYPLSAFLTEYSERNDANAYKPVAVGRYGIRARESIYSKELAKDYSKNKLIRKNTLTVGMGSTQIDIGVLTDDVTYSVSPAYHTYRITGINASYLRYCLEHLNRDMFVRFVKRGSRQGKTIDLKRWLTYEIPVCDAARQEEIVDRLDRVVGLIEDRRAQLHHLDELVKSRFVETFGDPEKNTKKLPIGSIADCAENLDSMRVPITRGDRIPGPYPYIGASGEVDRVASYIFDEPLLLVSEDGANLVMRNSPIAFTVTGKTWVNNHAHVLRCKSEGMRTYLEALINFVDISSWVTGSAQPKLNQKMLNKIPIPLAPDGDMQEFAVFVQQVDKSKFAVQQTIDKLELLKASLMQKYFG